MQSNVSAGPQMNEYTGWLLDLYEDPENGLVLWLLAPPRAGLAENGQRLLLRQRFPVTFYAAGPGPRLRALERFLDENYSSTVKLSYTEKRDLFVPQPVTLLVIQVAQPAQATRLFSHLQRIFPDLTYYDADIPLALRHAAAYGSFPLAHCRVTVTDLGWVQEIQVLDTPWELDPPPPPLQILTLTPQTDPNRTQPTRLLVSCGPHTCRLDLEPARPLLVNLNALLTRYDPDLLLTDWGDTWLLPHLEVLSRKAHLPISLNRDPARQPQTRPERTYFSYGQIIYRGQQVHLFGRWHIDRHNATLWKDYGLEGTLEAARVTALPVQNAARVSPGTGISSMQILTALRNDILVPWHKQQAERPKTALDLIRYDQGGMVYQPTIGLHKTVGEIDFISMYPSIMVRCNISPEVPLPNLLTPSDPNPGLIPKTLAPLLKKRIALKQRLGNLPNWHPQYPSAKARSSAHKWLLVTCFGYLGYKNARFGRIESHEAVTSNGREALLRAKETAEDLGFTVLHMFVDGLWVQKEGASQPADFHTLLDQIAECTGLPIALDGIFRWVVFLPSRMDKRVPVPNRYFGVFQDGSIKVRGIEARRHDTPPFISQTQMDLLRIFAQAENAGQLPGFIPSAVDLVRRQLARLRGGQMSLEQLLVTQKLSRDLEAYKDPSPAAQAATQLQAVGKSMRPGQSIRFIYLRGSQKVHAWELPCPPDSRMVDMARYRTLLLRAAYTIFQPMGVSQAAFEAQVTNTLPDTPLALPLTRKLAHPSKMIAVDRERDCHGELLWLGEQCPEK